MKFQNKLVLESKEEQTLVLNQPEECNNDTSSMFARYGTGDIPTKEMSTNEALALEYIENNEQELLSYPLIEPSDVFFKATITIKNLFTFGSEVLVKGDFAASYENCIRKLISHLSSHNGEPSEIEVSYYNGGEVEMIWSTIKSVVFVDKYSCQKGLIEFGKFLDTVNIPGLKLSWEAIEWCEPDVWGDMTCDVFDLSNFESYHNQYTNNVYIDLPSSHIAVYSVDTSEPKVYAESAFLDHIPEEDLPYLLRYDDLVA